jgi:hypothetical protein
MNSWAQMWDYVLWMWRGFIGFLLVPLPIAALYFVYRVFKKWDKM